MPEFIVSSHGGRPPQPERPSSIVPEGSTVKFYVSDGQILDNVKGYEIFTALAQGTSIPPSVQTIFAGGNTFNYGAWYATDFPSFCGIWPTNCWPPTQPLPRATQQLNRYTEAAPFYLMDIFAAYPNSLIHWVACRSVLYAGDDTAASPEVWPAPPPAS